MNSWFVYRVHYRTWVKTLAGVYELSETKIDCTVGKSEYEAAERIRALRNGAIGKAEICSIERSQELVACWGFQELLGIPGI